MSRLYLPPQEFERRAAEAQERERIANARISLVTEVCYGEIRALSRLPLVSPRCTRIELIGGTYVDVAEPIDAVHAKIRAAGLPPVEEKC